MLSVIQLCLSCDKPFHVKGDDKRVFCDNCDEGEDLRKQRLQEERQNLAQELMERTEIALFAPSQDQAIRELIQTIEQFKTKLLLAYSSLETYHRQIEALKPLVGESVFEAIETAVWGAAG